MGLRLYQAPVESDIQPKPAADKRSPEARALHRARRATRIARNSASHGRASRSAYSPPTVNNGREPVRPAQARQALRDMASRMDMADLHYLSSPDPIHDSQLPSARRDADDEDLIEDELVTSLPAMPPIIMDDDLHLFRDSQPTPPPHPSNERTRHHHVAPPSAPSAYTPYGGNSSLRDQPSAAPPRQAVSGRTATFGVTLSTGDNEARRLRAQQLLRRRAMLSTRPRAMPSIRPRSSLEEAQLDGLGDRNRSLTPEAMVWDTLLATIPPDPQPPSVGSSFASASASASARASQSAANSSNTSLTGPDTADDSLYEPPCESGCEGSDTEGDDDEEAEENPLIRFAPGLRSYADVAASGPGTTASSGDDPLEMLGGLGGFQRIVRSLSAREDIPDEWWAEAGLSRTLSREPSA